MTHHARKSEYASQRSQKIGAGMRPKPRSVSGKSRRFGRDPTASVPRCAGISPDAARPRTPFRDVSFRFGRPRRPAGRISPSRTSFVRSPGAGSPIRATAVQALQSQRSLGGHRSLRPCPRNTEPSQGSVVPRCPCRAPFCGRVRPKQPTPSPAPAFHSTHRAGLRNEQRRGAIKAGSLIWRTQRWDEEDICHGPSARARSLA
jgi:hypothetical protein